MITELPRIGRGRVSEARRQEFRDEVAKVAAWMRTYVDRLGFAPVARSWLYALESAGIITKGEFQMAGKWLADQRKDGLIPLALGAQTPPAPSRDTMTTTGRPPHGNTSTAS